MPSNLVTVQSARGTTVTLSYDSSANATLANYIASAIQSGIGGGTIVPADSAFSGSPPPLHGKIGEWVQDTSGPNPTLPKGYDYIVDSAPASTMIDQNTDTNQAVLVGSGNLFFNASGAGSIIGGGGNDQIIIPASDSGSWFVALGSGNDTIKALGGGNDTISLGAGNDSIMLGSGHSVVTTNGAATISASTGNETVTGNGTTVVYGNASNLTFVAGGGATVFGGTGSDTATGGAGPDYFVGGAAGNNSLTAGVGSSTLVGGGGSDTFVGSSGAVTVVAAPSAGNVFEFFHGSAGGTEFVSGLTSIGQVDLHLVGYSGNDTSAVASQNNGGGNLNITLTDGTQITFQNITSPLTNSNFS